MRSRWRRPSAAAAPGSPGPRPARARARRRGSLSGAPAPSGVRGGGTSWIQREADSPAAATTSSPCGPGRARGQERRRVGRHRRRGRVGVGPRRRIGPVAMGVPLGAIVERHVLAARDRAAIAGASSDAVAATIGTGSRSTISASSGARAAGRTARACRLAPRPVLERRAGRERRATGSTPADGRSPAGRAGSRRSSGGDDPGRPLVRPGRRRTRRRDRRSRRRRGRCVPSSASMIPAPHGAPGIGIVAIERC